MKRLLKISFDSLLTSVFPILSWIALSIILDKNLINVFSLTFPLQFVGWLLSVIFATGANIHKEKDKNDNAVMSGLVIASIIGFIVFSFIVMNVESYLQFMNVDINIYKEFTIYSVLQIYIGFIFSCIIERLYFEEKNTKANKYTIIYNLIGLVSLVLFALTVKERMLIVILAVIARLVCALVIVFRNFEKFKLQCNISKFIKYTSESALRLLMFSAIFLIGYRIAFSFGTEYVIALTFIGIISDTQWDIIITSITAVAKIDIAKNKFNYKEHIRNGYILCGLIIASMVVMAVCLWRFYELPATFTFSLLCLEVYAFIIYPISAINVCFLQLDYSPKKTTANQFIVHSLRGICSFIKTPYNTTMGQIIGATYELVSTNVILRKNYIINREGVVEKKK